MFGVEEMFHSARVHVVLPVIQSASLCTRYQTHIRKELKHASFSAFYFHLIFLSPVLSFWFYLICFSLSLTFPLPPLLSLVPFVLLSLNKVTYGQQRI